MIDEKLLAEKLKYLMILELKGRYTVKDFNMELDLVEDGDTIESYYVHVKVLSIHGVDPSVEDFIMFLERCNSDIAHALNKYQFTKDGKLSPTGEGNFHLKSEYLFEVKYETDEFLLVSLSFKFA